MIQNKQEEVRKEAIEPEHLRALSDNWAHRSKGMLCLTCMHYCSKTNDPSQVELKIGRCRKHAPELGGWPAVWPSDWCGDHKIRG